MAARRWRLVWWQACNGSCTFIGYASGCKIWLDCLVTYSTVVAVQYYGSHLHGYAVLGSVGSHLLYRQARWLCYDLSFLAMCTACWEHGSEPAVLSIGIPINLVQWQMPLAMSVIQMMLADGLQGVYLEALVASVVVHFLSQVGSKLFMDERPDHLQV